MKSFKRLVVFVLSIAIIISSTNCIYAKRKTYWIPWEYDGKLPYTSANMKLFGDAYDYSDKWYSDPGCSIYEDDEKHDWCYEYKTAKGYKKYWCVDCGCLKYVPVKKAKKITKNDKKKIRKTISKYFKSAKKYQVNAMNICFSNKNCSVGYPTNKKFVNNIRVINKKIKFRIKKITGKKKKATVVVKIKTPYLYSDFYNVEMKGYNDYLNSDMSISAEEAGSKIADDMCNIISKSFKQTRMRTKTIKIHMKKIRNRWKIKKKTVQLVDMATAYYGSAYLDFGDDIQ